jgi:putative flippase GtrA
MSTVAGIHRPRGRGPNVVATLRRLLRYAAVSVVSVTVAQTVLGVLVATRATGAVVANVIATAVATVPSFALNRRWVWGKSGRASVSREMLPFAIVTAAGLALSTVAVAISARVADDYSTTMRTLTVQAASLSAFGVVWVVQFVLLDRILFRQHGDRRFDDADAVDHDTRGCTSNAASANSASPYPHAPSTELRPW